MDTAIPLSRAQIHVTFSGLVKAASINALTDWTITTSDGAVVDIHTVTLPIGITVTEADLFVHPGLTAGASYTVEAPNAVDGGDADVDPDEAVAAIPTGFVITAGDVIEEFPVKLLKAILHAVGRQVQIVYGRPVTRLVRDYRWYDAKMFVETTLAMPDEGAVWTDGLRFTYDAKGDGAFHNIQEPGPFLQTIPAGTPVYLDQSSVISA
jgi:hypothetical protein